MSILGDWKKLFHPAATAADATAPAAPPEPAVTTTAPAGKALRRMRESVTRGPFRVSP